MHCVGAKGHIARLLETGAGMDSGNEYRTRISASLNGTPLAILKAHQWCGSKSGLLQVRWDQSMVGVLETDCL